MKNVWKIIWGIFFVLAAVYLIVSQLYDLPQFSILRILLTVCFAAMIIDGIPKINFYEILFGAAFICCLYDEWMGIEKLTPWPVLGAALFGSIGLSLLFRRKKKSWSWNNGDNGFEKGKGEQYAGEHLKFNNSFGSAIKYISSDNFCNAELDNVFGTLTVYLDNAIIQNPTAFVNISNTFGTTNLYVPRMWQVENRLARSFGSVQEEGRWEGNSAHILYLRGETNFGSIVIYYI